MTGERIKVLHLVESGWPGGVNSFVLELLRSIDLSRFPIGICSFSSAGPVLDAMRELGAEVLTLDQSARFDPRTIWKYWHWIRAHGYQIVHANFGARLPRCTAQWTGCRTIAHAHGLPDDWPRRSACQDPRLEREFKAGYGGCADSIVACSQSLSETMRQVCPALASRISVIPNGLDLQRWRPIAPPIAPPIGKDEKRQRRLAAGLPGDAIVIGFAGRLVQLKRLDCLLEAAPRLAARHPQVHFLVLGDGPLRPALERQAHVLGDRCRFLGWGHGSDWLPLFDVLVLPSESEGLPYCVLEAMALGIPVVASAVGGLREAVVEGQTGFLVPPGDAPALEAALERLIADSEMRQKIGLAGRLRAESLYDSRVMARRFEELYERLCRPI
jgi:glycosyltransferase involved in cell wall biosynthesis